MSDDKARRWRCEVCQTISTDTEALIGKHPFAPGSITGCPVCKAAHDSTAVLICDEPGCDDDAACAWPSPEGYRNTCYKHWEGKP